MATGDPYCTDAELIAYLRMDSAAAAEAAAQITLAALAASRFVESYTRRDFNLASSATARYYDVLSDGTVLVDDIGDATVTIATDTTNDGTFATSWASTDFQLSPLGALAAGQPASQLVAVGSYTFPGVSRRRGLVKVTAKWGWPSVPKDVKLATLIEAAKLLKRRDSAEGVLGGGDFGLVRVGSRVDPDVAALLDPYRYVLVG